MPATCGVRLLPWHWYARHEPDGCRRNRRQPDGPRLSGNRLSADYWRRAQGNHHASHSQAARIGFFPNPAR